MKDEHITFAELSDLCDNEPMAKSDRLRVERHLKRCRVCLEELRRLKEMLRLCRQIASSPLPLADMPAATMRRARLRRQRRLALKSLPAIAASVVVVAGVWLQVSGLFVSQPPRLADGGRSSYTESERVIDIIRRHRATIRQVTDEYVEGRVPAERFAELRKSLGGRRVSYMPVDETDASSGSAWDSAIEQVGLDEDAAPPAWIMPEQPVQSNHSFVLFRVYR